MNQPGSPLEPPGVLMPGSRPLTFTQNHLLYLSSTFKFCSENKSQPLVPRCCFPTRPSSRIGAHRPAMALPRAGTGTSLCRDPWGSLWGTASPSPAPPQCKLLKSFHHNSLLLQVSSKVYWKWPGRAVNLLSADPALPPHSRTRRPRCSHPETQPTESAFVQLSEGPFP